MASSEDMIKVGMQQFLGSRFGAQASSAQNAGNDGLGKQGYQSGFGKVSPVGKMDTRLGVLQKGPETGPNQTKFGTMQVKQKVGVMKGDDMMKAGMLPGEKKQMDIAARIVMARNAGRVTMAENAGKAKGFTTQANPETY